MWDLPIPGIEPVSLELAGGFLITGPPGKSTIVFLKQLFLPEINVHSTTCEATGKIFLKRKCPWITTRQN